MHIDLAPEIESIHHHHPLQQLSPSMHGASFDTDHIDLTLKMNLCKKCSEINLEALSKPWGYQLEKDYFALERSASYCRLCDLLYRLLNSTVEWPNLCIALHGKPHNPNYPDKNGFAEIQVQYCAPRNARYFDWNMVKPLELTLRIAVRPGEP